MGMMPWMMGTTTTQNDVQRGFDQSAIMSGLTGISSALASGFANAEISRCRSYCVSKKSNSIDEC